MNGVCDATEWFCFTDKIQRFIGQSQNYVIYPYLQYGFVVWHFIFAKLNAWPKINFPSKGYEVRCLILIYTLFYSLCIKIRTNN